MLIFAQTHFWSLLPLSGPQEQARRHLHPLNGQTLTYITCFCIPSISQSISRSISVSCHSKAFKWFTYCTFMCLSSYSQWWMFSVAGVCFYVHLEWQSIKKVMPHHQRLMFTINDALSWSNMHSHLQTLMMEKRGRKPFQVTIQMFWRRTCGFS